MPLCSICRNIPYRKIIHGDESLSHATYDEGHTYRVKSHASIADLFLSARSCEFCNVISRSIESSISYQGYMTLEDKNQPLWLNIRFGGSPSGEVQVYRGTDTEPVTMIFGKKLRIYVALDDPMARTIEERHVQPNPIHDLALRQIDSWLADCAHGHSQCSPVATQSMKLPTRVLDLDALPGKDSMIANRSWNDLFSKTKCKLIQSQFHEQGQYVALSYCWGKTLAFKTTKDNLERHKSGFDFKALPKTLQDAIQMTRYLNVRYIWIDCLCIVQDDKADWEREAALMADVYSNAFLTVAAARASDSSEGFLGRRETRPMYPVQFEDELGSFRFYFYDHDISAGPGAVQTVQLDPLVSEPLSTRVWTLQERVLAPRTLHFGSTQMFWECNGAWKGEDGLDLGAHENTGFRLDYIVQGLRSHAHLYNKDNLRRLWHILVESYTSRNLSFQSDRLPALSGVIDALQRQTNDKCYAGIWKTHFLEGLNWRLLQHDLYRSLSKQPKRSDTWRAPSWSFAAVEGLVSYERASIGGDPCAELEECNLTPSGLNPLGELKDGYARVRGPVISIERTDEMTDFQPLYFVRLRNRDAVRAIVDFDCESYDHCSVLMLSSSAGLAIVPAVGRDRYVRVGVVEVFNKFDAATRSWYSSGHDPLSYENYPPPSSVVLL